MLPNPSMIRHFADERKILLSWRKACQLYANLSGPSKPNFSHQKNRFPTLHHPKHHASWQNYSRRSACICRQMLACILYNFRFGIFQRKEFTSDTLIGRWSSSWSCYGLFAVFEVWLNSFCRFMSENFSPYSSDALLLSTWVTLSSCVRLFCFSWYA